MVKLHYLVIYMPMKHPLKQFKNTFDLSKRLYGVQFQRDVIPRLAFLTMGGFLPKEIEILANNMLDDSCLPGGKSKNHKGGEK